MKPVEFRVPIELVMAVFFLLIALVMVGPGQEMGRAFNRVPSRTTAYRLNLLGSLVGIGMFAACSFLQLPPIVWFGLRALGLAYFLSRPIDHPRAEAPLADKPGGWAPYVFLALIPLVTLPTSGVGVSTGDRETTWSPYYRIDY